MKKLLIASLLTIAMAGAAQADNIAAAHPGNSSQTVLPAHSLGSFAGPDAWFTGEVKVDMLFNKTADLQASGASVTFQPGARTAWHLHPAGQTLIVTAGKGLTGYEGGKTVELNPGDVVQCPAGVRHWHGASPDSAMTHIAITGYDADDQNVEWFEKVSDAEYLGQATNTKP